MKYQVCLTKWQLFPQPQCFWLLVYRAGSWRDNFDGSASWEKLTSDKDA
jgi:hypothetical protein